jgi:hypothetical protein
VGQGLVEPHGERSKSGTSYCGKVNFKLNTEKAFNGITDKSQITINKVRFTRRGSDYFYHLVNAIWFFQVFIPDPPNRVQGPPEVSSEVPLPSQRQPPVGRRLSNGPPPVPGSGVPSSHRI